MLVCPKCQFENPDNNNFCQSCGTSLRFKSCSECGAQVDFTERNCPKCNAFSATIRWAIVSKTQSDNQETAFVLSATETLQQELESPNEDATIDFTSTNTLNVLPLEVQTSEGEINKELQSIAVAENNGNDRLVLPITNQYLDTAKRYELYLGEDGDKFSIYDSKSGNKWYQFRVIDAQPLHRSVLDVMDEEETAFLGVNVDVELNNNRDRNLPALAFAYLNLKELSPIVPELHDAFIEGDLEVILLPDRSEWQLLIDFWQNNKLPTAVILMFLDDMAQQWTFLQEVHCCQSLLEINNLRIDEDEIFCFQQLYPDPPNTNPSIKELARVWQILLKESGNTLFSPLAKVLQQTVVGDITTIESLRLEFQKIAQTLDSASEEILDSAELELNLAQFSSEENAEEENTREERDLDEAATGFSLVQLLNLSDAGLTNIGRQRDHNEDYFSIISSMKKEETLQGKETLARGFYIVCDGMGGHASGEVASNMAVETLLDYFQEHWQDTLPDRDTICEGILTANHKLYQENMQNARHGSGRMGTTLVMALVQDTQIAIAHVGDSRIYRLTRQQGLEQLTTDHEVGQREIQRGAPLEIAYARPDAYQLTQALGPRDNDFVKPDIKFLEAREDSLFLLCSDGLSDNDLIENHFSTYLTPLLDTNADLEEGVSKLIDFANDYNGHDNITGIIIKMKLKTNLKR
jgi:protein phosphatase